MTPFGKVPGAVIMNTKLMDLSQIELAAYLAIVVRIDGRTWSWTGPSSELIKNIGCSRSAFFVAVAKLRERGLIDTQGEAGKPSTFVVKSRISDPSTKNGTVHASSVDGCAPFWTGVDGSTAEDPSTLRGRVHPYNRSKTPTSSSIPTLREGADGSVDDDGASLKKNDEENLDALAVAELVEFGVARPAAEHVMAEHRPGYRRVADAIHYCRKAADCGKIRNPAAYLVAMLKSGGDIPQAPDAGPVDEVAAYWRAVNQRNADHERSEGERLRAEYDRRGKAYPDWLKTYGAA